MTYNYKIRIEKLSGDPIQSHCECPSGKGPHGTCKHIAAILLMIQDFTETGNLWIQKTCTETLQSIHCPKSLYEGTHIIILHHNNYVLL